MYLDQSASDYGLSDVTFQPLKRKRPKFSSHKNERSKDKLLVPRRIIRVGDKREIISKVREVTDKDFGSIDIAAKSDGFGVSCLTPKMARRIFNQYHDTLGETDEKVRVFNNDIMRYIEEMNGQNPTIFARLGAIGIYGARPDHMGKRFVGASIMGSPGDCLAGEHLGLVRELTPIHADDMMNQAHRYRPHISFAETHSQELAEKLRDALRDVGISGTWVELNRAQPIACSVE